MRLPQWPQQLTQSVVVNFLHEGDEPANVAFGNTVAHKPVQVVSGQVSNAHASVVMSFCMSSALMGWAEGREGGRFMKIKKQK